MIGNKEFVHLLRSAFPGKIDRHIMTEKGIYVQMKYFVDFTQAAIGNGDLSRVVECFSFVNRILDVADDELFNALCVGYLEHLDFSGTNGKIAFELLPPKLLLQWKELEAYWRKLSEERQRKGHC